MFILIVISVIGLVRGLPVDYNYDNYVNVNLDNTNANAYYMDNKPGFDYSVNYPPPFSNYYGVYRQEPMATPAVKPHFVYPFHTIFVITTAPHGQSSGSGVSGGMMDQSMTNQQGGQFFDQQDHQQSMLVHHSSSDQQEEQEQQQQEMPVLLKHDFEQNGPVSTSGEVVPVPVHEQEYPVLHHTTSNDENEQMVDYPIVINAQPPQNDDDESEVQVKDDHIMMIMDKDSKIELVNDDDDNDDKPKAVSTESTVTTTTSPVIVSSSSEIDVMTTQSPSSKLVQNEEEPLKKGEEMIIMPPSATFETIDADDEIFMTTESPSGIVGGQEQDGVEEKVTTEPSA